MNIPQILTALAINAVPALGWLVGDWNSGTTLAVYWCETVIASLFIGVRTMIHSRLAPKRGHFRYAPLEAAKQNGADIPFLKHFLPVTLAFSAVHLVFLAAFVFILTKNGRGDQVRLNFHEVLTGCGLILLFQIVDLIIDTIRMKGYPFRWIEQMAERNIGRVMIIHLTIMIGMAVGGATNGSRGFFLVFVVLKTMNDLNNLVPQYDPEEAPKWLCWLMDKVPNVAKTKGPASKQTFAEFWKADKTGEKQRRAKNEQPYTP